LFICLAIALALAPAQAAPQPAAARLTALQKTDTQLGSGRMATVGSTVSVHYAAWLYAPHGVRQRGAAFDTSVGAAPFTFKLGAGKVIKGWDEGVRGMRAGGKRTLAVPAAMGFGKLGRGSVPANANLVFDIELLEVK
jgi:FKBP-type peptidyl-prolyl cis-trans isomerase FkpA